ncbi:MAG: stage 0 sporulation protein [Desulfobacteraceae bacterium]|nr:stage 0 sporulation protein [Desulfobacteraceae bacterium]
MKKVAGIKFKNGGKVYDFESFALVLNIGDKVIVETEQGQGFGIVEIPPKELNENKNKKNLKQILRVATIKDLEKREDNIQLEKRAFNYCEKCVDDLKLVMNLFSVESTFDRNKLIFFYTADGRVDFRELVKLLVKEYNIRIEMRQVGIRNLAKHCGGVGKCGRELCCSSFINNFAPVSIKMAKTQGLSLNPAKISGVCGRLMCCLTFEDAVYNQTRSMLPKIGAKVEISEGRGKVVRQNVLKEKLTIRLEDNTEIEKHNSDIL